MHFRQFASMTLLFVTAMVVVFCGPKATAQSGAGSIQGTVTDSTGAVIPNASIHVVNLATGVAVDTRTNNVGFYQVPELFTGSYSVTISVTGMKTYKRTIDLLVDQNAVINATLSPGAVTQQVQVNANAVQLTDTANGVLGSTLENQRINQLPMNGRDLLTLTNEVTPGLDACGQAPSCANGLMPGATDYEVDGVTLESDMFGGTNANTAALPDPDSIQEVSVETSGVGAQYATPAVGVMTTKSGTNQLHGSFFETARNNAFGIAKQRQDPSNYAAPEYIRNEFGGSIGGPIILPHLYHGKDKSFFFFAYERYSLAQHSYTETKVPTMAMRSGDWSGLVNGSGVLQQLYDPDTTTANATCPTNTTGTANNTWCRTPFPTSANGAPNQIPIGRLSPTARILYAILPPPTTNVNPLVADNFDNPDSSIHVTPTITFRLDHNFDENNRAYLRYTSTLTSTRGLTSGTQPETTAATVNGVNFPAGLYGILTDPDTLFATAAGYTHIFSPTFFSETVLSQQWFGQWAINSGPALNTDVEQEMGLPNNFGEDGFPEISNSLDPMNGTQGNYGLTQIISAIDENLTKTTGKHQFQFGGRYRHERFGYQSNQQHDEALFGAYTTALENPGSGKNYTGYSNTGYADADMFLGGADQYNVWLQPPYIHWHDMEFDGYFQDNYHVTRSLTLNLGLRYEAHPATWVKNGTLTGFDLKNDAEVLGAPASSLIAEGYTTQAIITNIENDGGKIETAQQAGLPSTLLKNYDLDFLPRAGFAWQMFGKLGTVLRGAYGRFTYPVPTYFSMSHDAESAPFEAEYSESYISAAQSPDGLPDYLLRAPQTTASSGGTPIMGVNTTNVVNTASTTSILPGINLDTLDPDFAPDQVTQANVTIEQPMKGNSALRISWVYAHDANLWENYYFNDHPSSYIWEMQTGTVPPTGGASAIGTNQYSATATGPYDKITWGGSTYRTQKTGWSTDNQLQANYERLFHHGIAYQISYILSKPMHTGGESGSDGNVYPYADFIGSAPNVSTMTSPYGTTLAPTLPPPPPAGYANWQYYKALARYEYYRVDTSFPKQEIKFNGIVDLPVGRDKWLLSNANHFVNELVGGWQVAGDGNISSQDFTITSTHWGPTNPLHIYKHKMPVEDCRSGTCFKEYEWFNGYVAPTVNANVDCTNKCLSGLTSNWAPYQTPIDNTPGTTYYGDDEVDITLPNGKPTEIAYSPVSSISGANPFSHTTLNGPFNWTADASLFKVFPINERINLRFNMDAFNVFNYQGAANPSGSDGTTPCTAPGGVGCSSPNAARQVQFTLRLTF